MDVPQMQVGRRSRFGKSCKYNNYKTVRSDPLLAYPNLQSNYSQDAFAKEKEIETEKPVVNNQKATWASLFNKNSSNVNGKSSNAVRHEVQKVVVEEIKAEEKVIEREEPVVNNQRRTWASLFNNNSSNVNLQNGNNVNGNSSNAVEPNINVNNINNNNGELHPIGHDRKSLFIDPNCYRMGEFLLSHNVDGRTTSLQPRGLINRSNYCYFNSILQALFACPPMYNLINGLSQSTMSSETRKTTPIIDGMCRFVKQFQHLSVGRRVNRRKDQDLTIDYDRAFEPFWMYNMFNGIRSGSFMVKGRQEDAEEFLGCILNGLNDEMLELMKLVQNRESSENETDKVFRHRNKGSITTQFEFAKTPIRNIFGGLLKSGIHRTGERSTYNIEPFFTLQLNIKNVRTVSEAIKELGTASRLEGLISEKTNKEVEAYQQVTLEELPVILVLHLKRFDLKPGGYCTKIMKALEFPIDLTIDSDTTPKQKQYQLFAVVYHKGMEATEGHYVTDAFHVGYGSWIRYDDASVRAVREEDVLKPQGNTVPYLLFYRRRDTIASK